MFEVRTKSPMDEGWQDREAIIFEAAGCESDFSGAGIGPLHCHGRDHGWNVKTFEEARAMKLRLDALPDVNATIRERSTSEAAQDAV